MECTQHFLIFYIHKKCFRISTKNLGTFLIYCTLQHEFVIDKFSWSFVGLTSGIVCSCDSRSTIIMSCRIVNLMDFFDKMKCFLLGCDAVSFRKWSVIHTAHQWPKKSLIYDLYMTDHVTLELVSFEHWRSASSSAFSTTV